MFQRIAPILPALNLIATNLFYRDKLNFSVSYSGNYLVAAKENIQLFFFEQDKKIFIPAACRITVINIEDMYSRFCSMNLVSPGGQMKELPGQIKEFHIYDNNRHQLMFAEMMR